MHSCVLARGICSMSWTLGSFVGFRYDGEGFVDQDAFVRL